MKRTLVLAMALVLGAGVTACRDTTGPQRDPTPKPDQDPGGGKAPLAVLLVLTPPVA